MANFRRCWGGLMEDAEKFLAFMILPLHLTSQLWLYDVFLSFRGEDVRKGFLSHVVKEFKSKGISTFIDNEMERGQSVGPALVGAIRQSRVAIVLLSRNYASSSWCLDELVEIMKCREENQQRVMTIFYEVDPSDVRKQTRDFGKAFEKTCVEKTEEVTYVWRQALKEVADIAGYASSNWETEADLINELATNIMGVLPLTPSNDFDDFVGIEPRVTEMKTMLTYKQKMLSTFLENIKGCFERSCGNDHHLKLRFQEKLLSQIFNQKDIVAGHLGWAPQKLSDKKVLVVLDEVDSWWQLEEMAKREWFGPGSMIIITTEDKKLLKALRLEANQIYEMKLPTRDEAYQILYLYAFGQKFLNYHFETLAWEVAILAGNLPLGLRVMGSYLGGMSENEWIDALPSLRSSLHGEIEATLKLSYNGTGTVLGIKLHNLEGEEIKISKSGFQGIRNLQFLDIDVGTLNTPEGAFDECFPNKLRYIHWSQAPMRFWPSKFSGKFLVELIMPNSNFETLWEGIKPLPCLKRMDLSFSVHLKEIPDLSTATSLEIFNVYGCVSLLELTSSIGNATRLGVCILKKCCLLKELPSSFGRLINLEVLNMSGELKKFPNVPYSIVVLELSNTGIEEIPPWIENLYGLQELYMIECRNLEIVSPNISKLENLHTIELCKGRETIYDDGFFGAEIKWGRPDLKRPFELSSNESVKTIPDCIKRLSGLSELSVRGFRMLTALPQLPVLQPESKGEKAHPDISLQICLLTGFKACIVLFARFRIYGLQTVSCCVRDSFSIDQDFPEAEDATFSELSFLFTVNDDEALEIRGCGVRILEVLDGKETEYQEYIDTNIEANNENTDDDEGDDDDYDKCGWSTDDVGEDIEDDVDDNDAGFSDEVILQ
ncbi:Disease resistance protein (TIR-NBS-LRR class) family [Raphanus sativus]|nr:Disease resistance protein (TIR-NBS-LRR class) family [Raphanus sativus]